MENIYGDDTIQAVGNLLAKNPEYVNQLLTIQDRYRDYIEEKIQTSAND